MSFESITTKVARYYSARLGEFGSTARGVDWNSEASQVLRFRQLARLLPESGHFSLLDYGCGYGALIDFLETLNHDFDYQGYDLSVDMIDQARKDHHGSNRAFSTDEAQLETADYSIASGIFNVKLDTPLSEWEGYVAHTLDSLDALGRSGFAFNMLTSYSDADRMRQDLFYGDPRFYFGLCKRQYSKQVALLHDYGLYEFTMIVRK